MKSFTVTLRSDTFTLNFNVLFQGGESSALAIAYHNLAVEQEALGLYQEALDSYVNRFFRGVNGLFRGALSCGR